MWLIFSRFGISFHRHGLTTIQEMSCFQQIITHVHETMMTDLYYFFLPLLEFFLFYFPYFSHYYWLFSQQNHSSGLPPNDWLILSHPDIAVTDKFFYLDTEKEQISGILFFLEKISCSRSRHLVLWSLETLTGQHRFYGMRLVTQKERCYHPLSILPEAGCIAGFVSGDKPDH